MLQSAAAPLVLKPRAFRHSTPLVKPKVRVSLDNNKVMLNVSIPSLQPDGKEILITGGTSSQPGLRDEVVFLVIKEMIHWIESHLDQNLSVEKISGRSGYSIWHFQRKFLQLIGLNVYEYVRIRRVINSTFILIRSNQRILEIAVENGFSCQPSFTRTIKGITGFTPAELRRKFSGNEKEWIEIIESLINPRAERKSYTDGCINTPEMQT